MSSFGLPTGGQRKRLARALQLERRHLPVRLSFTTEGGLRGATFILPDGRHATLALDPASTRPVPNVHIGDDVLLGPSDLGILVEWMGDVVTPAFDDAIRTSTMVMKPQACLEVLEPIAMPHHDRAKHATRKTLEAHEFEPGMRKLVAGFLDQVESQSVPQVDSQVMYGACFVRGWPLVDIPDGVVIVPGLDFDIVISQHLAMSKLLPLMEGPAAVILDMLDIDRVKHPYDNATRLLPYQDVVAELRHAGARFLTEAEQRGWDIIR